MQNKTLVNNIIEVFKRDENLAFKYVYQNEKNKFISNLTMRNSGISKDECLDIFQDAIIVLYDNINKSKINQVDNLSGYLISIGQNIVYKKLRLKKKKHQHEKHSLGEKVSLNALDFLNEDNDRSKIKNLLNQLGIQCQQLIVGFYIKGLDMKELASFYNYSSANTVKSQKHKCIKQLRKHYHESRR